MLKPLLALLFVIGLMGILALLARKYLRPHMPNMSKLDRKMKVLEVLPLDQRRKLVRFSCLDCEYLILTGGGNDLLLDTKKIIQIDHEKA